MKTKSKSTVVIITGINQTILLLKLMKTKSKSTVVIICSTNENLTKCLF